MFEDIRTLDHALADYRALQDEYERMSQRMMLLEAALKFYANRNNYNGANRHLGYRDIDVDNGSLARNTLKGQTP